MKHIFLDTNIIIDLISNREPFGKSAIQIFQGAESKNINCMLLAIQLQQHIIY